ncbi:MULTISPECIES: hypothetical protein [Bacillus]|uniref:hypothetical protein n=1 Tax=Bacillus TaxID=1386 RepID=UPI0002ECDCC5|nr:MULTISPECIES: hypothetical protein [Bacillus]
MSIEIVDRYVYAVVSKLPVKQRSEMDKEIRSLIDDVMENYSSEESEEKRAEKALLELGDPNTLADQYIEKKRYLIGPENFHNYLYVMKIVLYAVFIGISIAFAIDIVFVKDINFSNMIGDYFATIISALFQAVAWVTIIFAIADYKGVNLGNTIKAGQQWSVKDLKPVPHKKSMISPTEGIFTIVFSSIVLMVLYFSPEIIGAYILNENDSYTVIPFLNSNVVQDYKIIIIAIFILSIAKEAAKLIYGRWDKNLAIIYTILSVLSTILFCFLISVKNLFNQSFMSDFSKHTDLHLTIGTNQFISVFIMIVILITIIDVVSALYKGFIRNR